MRNTSWDLDKLKAEFPYFVRMLWDHLLLPVPTPVQDDISNYLQHGPKRIVIEAFRGVGKSWLTSAFVIWSLLNDPQLRILVVSANKDRATAFSTFTKRLIAEVPVLQHLQPDPQKNQRDSVEAFDVGPARAHQAPSVKSAGIFGQITGSRADIIVADDIEVPKNSYTPGMRERLGEAIKEFSAILLPGEDKRIIYLGTPQTEASLYNMLPERGFKVRIWPARYPDQEWMMAYENSVAPWIKERLDNGTKIAGEPVDPDRFNELDLIERQGDYGRTGFALQFMLDTRLSDDLKFPLKHRDLIVVDVDTEKAPVKLSYGSDPKLMWKDLPLVGFTGDCYFRPFFISEEEWQNYQGSVLAIDPSGRGKDETGYAVIKMLYGRLFVTECSGFLGGYEDANLRKLAMVAKKHRVNQILVESNFGDGMWTKLFHPILNKIWPCTVEEVTHSYQKEMRIIDTLEPVMNQHRLIIGPDVIREDAKSELNYQLMYQMSRITRERGALAHDDRLEALAMAVGYWVDEMGVDVDTAHDKYQEHVSDQELEEFKRHFGQGTGNNALSVFTGR
jgi:hypothetical protein